MAPSRHWKRHVGNLTRRLKHAALASLALHAPVVAHGQVAAPDAPQAPPAPAPAPPAVTPPPPPASPAAVESESPPEDADIVLFDLGSKQDDSGLPPTLPRELRWHTKPGAPVQVEESKTGELKVEEIVVSASNRSETTLSAPAWVLVLTREDLRARGYTDLSQALDDLPGMDVIRPYGDVYVKSYWRGYRPGTGADPYLVMLDGIPLNHLFFGDTQILATFPISQIKRIEVVYGPASAVYGRNAAMGIINVITKDGRERLDKDDLGTRFEGRVTYGGAQRNLRRFADSTRIFDGTVMHVTKDYRLRVSAHVEDGVLDRSIGNDFEYTKPKYYADEFLWGSRVLAEHSNIAGQFRSPDRKRGFDARLHVGEFELGAQLLTLSTGLGTRLAADRFQTQTPWTTHERSFYGRHHGSLSPNVAVTTLVQFRQSDLAAPSTNLHRIHEDIGAPGGGPTFYSVEAKSSAFVLHQDFSIDTARSLYIPGDQLALNLGLRFTHSELSADYHFNAMTTFPLDGDDPTGNAIDHLGGSSLANATRLPGEELGTYLLAKYEFPQDNALHLGTRVDHSTITDSTSVTFRGGYAGTFDDLTVKLLYGQATYSPTAYDLRRASSLTDESSQTIEGALSYRLWRLALHADTYYITFTNPIISDFAGARNLADRRVLGADFGARLFLKPIHLWAYYSRYFVAEESTATSPDLQRIGDLAFDKVWAGFTYETKRFSGTLLGRWIGPREPVSTNPLGTVPSFLVLDANLVFSGVLYPGLWAGFRVSNLLDTRYSHPGMATAASGATPASFVGTTYIGSQDEHNSRLPQPRRSFFITAGLDL